MSSSNNPRTFFCNVRKDLRTDKCWDVLISLTRPDGFLTVQENYDNNNSQKQSKSINTRLNLKLKVSGAVSPYIPTQIACIGPKKNLLSRYREKVKESFSALLGK